MKIVLRCCVVLLVVMVGVSVQALEPLAPYDDFNAELINPNKWFGEEAGNAGREAVRQIQDNRLHLLSRFYGDTDSNSGIRIDFFELNFINPAAVKAIEARVQVSEFEATGCPNNPSITQVEARLGGAFFNMSTPTPGSLANDVIAFIRIVRRSNFPENALRVEAFVAKCEDATCHPFTATGLDLKDLGPINLGESAKLRIQWDQANHQFIFQRDGGPEVFSPYAVSDTAPPGFQLKFFAVSAFTANCTVKPRPVAFMDGFLDDVFVNESAAPVTPVTNR